MRYRQKNLLDSGDPEGFDQALDELEEEEVVDYLRLNVEYAETHWGMIEDSHLDPSVAATAILMGADPDDYVESIYGDLCNETYQVAANAADLAAHIRNRSVDLDPDFESDFDLDRIEVFLGKSIAIADRLRDSYGDYIDQEFEA